MAGNADNVGRSAQEPAESDTEIVGGVGVKLHHYHDPGSPCDPVQLREGSQRKHRKE